MTKSEDVETNTRKQQTLVRGAGHVQQGGLATHEPKEAGRTSRGRLKENLRVVETVPRKGERTNQFVYGTEDRKLCKTESLPQRTLENDA